MVKLQDTAGNPVDADWLAAQAVRLLEKASEEDEVDHGACAKYIDLIAKVLLPRVSKDAAKSDRDGEVAAARELVRKQMLDKLASSS